MIHSISISSYISLFHHSLRHHRGVLRKWLSLLVPSPLKAVHLTSLRPWMLNFYLLIFFITFAVFPMVCILLTFQHPMFTWSWDFLYSRVVLLASLQLSPGAVIVAPPQLRKQSSGTSPIPDIICYWRSFCNNGFFFWRLILCPSWFRRSGNCWTAFVSTLVKDLSEELEPARGMRPSQHSP